MVSRILNIDYCIMYSVLCILLYIIIIHVYLLAPLIIRSLLKFKIELKNEDVSIVTDAVEVSYANIAFNVAHISLALPI